MQKKVGAFLLWLLFSSICSPGQSQYQYQTLIRPEDRFELLMRQGDFYRDMQLNDFGRRVTDSAIFFYRQAYDLGTALHSPHLQTRSLLGIAYVQMLSDQPDSGRTSYHRAITGLQRLHDTQGEAAAWASLGTGIRDFEGPTRNEKIAAFRRSEELYRQTGKITDALREKEAVANVYLRAGRLDTAESLLQATLKEYTAIHYSRLYHTYDLLTGLYKTKGDWPHQLYYGLEMVRNAEEYAPKAELFRYYYIIGGFYSDAGMHSEALYYLRKAAEYNAAYSNHKFFYDQLKSLTDELLAEGKPEEALAYCKKSIAEAPIPGNDAKLYYNMSLGDCYLALGQTDSARDHYGVSQTCLLKEETSYNFSIYTYAFLYARLGRLYFTRHQFAIARSYLGKLDSVPPHIIKPAQLKSNELLRFRVDSAMGSFVSAIRHYQLYKNIEDSLLNVNKSRQIVEIQAKYETTQKEQEIKLLQTERNFITGGVGLMLVIAILLYYAYRTKRRLNLRLEDKQVEINQQNAELRAVVAEKDWLLKEVHHRVKNNLQIITSLLKTQSHFLEEGSARNAIRETLNRVQSMSLIHHQLYTESDISSIYLPSYISDLIFHLKNSFSDISKHINFRHKAEPIRMEAGQLIPIGLILNEAVTNSIKYAFPKEDATSSGMVNGTGTISGTVNGTGASSGTVNGTGASSGTVSGTICISLLSAGPNCLQLTISDDGIGLPAEADTRTTRSLGLQMIRMLTKQLDGKLIITGSPGVTIVVSFPLKYQHNE
ncbi:MAG TPA: histidine kinase dimerization/phosphoacceptor domain -containing protein [Puia sp.]|jgi:two-component sensor histidine kinase